MKIAALAGGVGGAKLVDGLAKHLPPGDLTVIVNTGDDFDHFGLRVCPDLDTVCYTLAGIANRTSGWGRANESWKAMSALEDLGGVAWFRLGDADLATHLERTRRLQMGIPLSQITKQFCEAWGIRHTVLPMTNAVVSTILHTDQGDLEFQEYFVHRRSEPRVSGFEFRGSETARAAPGVSEALEEADAIVICPSNPWVSIAPILAIVGLRALVGTKTAIAVSPIVGGRALKGPADKMFREMGIEPSGVAVAEMYRDILRGMVLDQGDSADGPPIQAMGIQTLICNTLMNTPRARSRLAHDVLDFVQAFPR